MITAANAADLNSAPAELLDKLRVDFYSGPSQAAFKATVEK
jgi:ATP-dependent Lon protease